MNALPSLFTLRDIPPESEFENLDTSSKCIGFNLELKVFEQFGKGQANWRKRQRSEDVDGVEDKCENDWSVVSQCSSMNAVIDEIYDFELAANEVYWETIVGQFTGTRQSLDKSFHGFYTPERQFIQDEIISYITRSSGSMEAGRWIIFTAGAMGVGKTHTIEYLKKYNTLADINSFVQIDQDEVRSLLPEWKQYVKEQGENAGSLLQKESGYLCEIALTECLKKGRNIIMDTSLRDSAWWKSEFKRIRKEYGEYYIGIMYMKSDIKTALARSQSRGLKTGRKVPAQMIIDSHAQCDKSFTILREFTDLSVVIDTSGPEPNFVSPSLNDFRLKWDHLVASRIRPIK